MEVLRPRKHSVIRKDHVAKQYPFKKMLVGDYFTDFIEYEPAIRTAASRANGNLKNRYFCVKIIDDEVLCIRTE
jgi:hypothetical protein